MAKITTEDCLRQVPNRFELVLYAAKRAKQLHAEYKQLEDLEKQKNQSKPTVAALKEIAKGIVPKNMI